VKRIPKEITLHMRFHTLRHPLLADRNTSERGKNGLELLRLKDFLQGFKKGGEEGSAAAISRPIWSEKSIMGSKKEGKRWERTGAKHKAMSRDAKEIVSQTKKFRSRTRGGVESQERSNLVHTNISLTKIMERAI